MRVHSQRDKQINNYPDFVPDEMLSEEQAFENHGQTLSGLNERGGMSVPEILFNINRKRLPWRESGAFTDTQDKIDLLNKLIAEFKANTP
jgi:hypothetical protein